MPIAGPERKNNSGFLYNPQMNRESVKCIELMHTSLFLSLHNVLCFTTVGQPLKFHTELFRSGRICSCHCKQGEPLSQRDASLKHGRDLQQRNCDDLACYFSG
jgi:hypothetical protein